MRSISTISVLVAVGALAVLAPLSAQADTRVFSFDDSSYGVSDPDCINPENPPPPMFNRPGYATQTKDYIATPAGCGEGLCGTSAGNDSLRTNFYSSTGTSSNELRFSWTTPVPVTRPASDYWVRMLTESAGGIDPIYKNPTVYLAPGAKISMGILIAGTDGAEDVGCNGNWTGAALEFSLIVRETGLNLPLGEDGGTTGTLEFVGVDNVGGTVDPLVPQGGISIPASISFVNVSWTLVDTDADTFADAVDVRIGTGSPVRKSIKALNGDGILSAPYNRGTLDGVAIRKPTADLGVKWFVNIDNVVIDAPGVTDPVAVHAPVFEYETAVTVTTIKPTATTVKLYKKDLSNNTTVIGTASTSDVPPADFSSGTYTFTGLTLHEGEQLSATQTLGGVESTPSAEVPVLSAALMKDNFDSYADTAALNAVWSVWGDQTEPDRITLDALSAASCPHSILEPATAGGTVATRAQLARGLPGAQAAGGYQGTDDQPLVLTVWVNHDPGTANRNWITLMGFSGHTLSSSAGRLTSIRMGMYNSLPATTTLYQAGILRGFTGYPDDAHKWYDLDAGPDGLTGTDPATRQGGVWQKWRIRVKTSTVEFLINNVLYKVLDRPNSTDTFDSVIIGSGYTNGPLAASYDNLSVTIGDQDPYPDPLPQPKVNGPLSHSSTSVSITSVSASATTVTAYKTTGSTTTMLGSPVTVSNQTSATVTFPSGTLVDGDIVQATQTIGGEESCLSSSRVKALGSLIGRVSVSMSIRDSTTGGWAGPVGASTANPGGSLEYVGAGTKVSIAPQGKWVTPGPGWQTLTFDPPTSGGTDPVISNNLGDGVVNGVGVEHWCVLDGFAFSIDPVAQRPGPYTIYIDSIENDGTVFGAFDTQANGATNIMFRNPRYSPSSSAQLATTPDIAAVSNFGGADGTLQSMQIQFGYLTPTTNSRFLRLTTYATTTLGNPMIRMDRPVTVKFLLCPSQPPTISGVLMDGATSVTVTNVDTAAETVKVYANGVEVGSTPGNGTATVGVTVSSLSGGQSVQATQVLDGSESCYSTAKIVGACSQVGVVGFPSVLGAGATSVTLTGIDTLASEVFVYADGGQIASALTEGNTTVTVTVPPLVRGQVITARQMINGLLGCEPASGQTVGPAGNIGNLRIALGVRDQVTNTTWAVGTTSPAVSGGIEWIGTSVTGTPQGKLITPGPAWQTVTFNPPTTGLPDPDPVVPALGTTGSDGVINGESYGGASNWCVIEHLAIAVDQADPRPGPYTLYIDSIENDGVVFGDFEAQAIGTKEVVFRYPSYSSTTSAKLSKTLVGTVSPNISEVTGDNAADGVHSGKIGWGFLSDPASVSSCWLRLTTDGAGHPVGNPEIRLDKPVTVKFLLCPGLPVSVGGILVAGAESVTVTGVAVSATTVNVYANGAPIGSASGNGTATVVVPVTALVENDKIQATQVVDGAEGCLLDGKIVGECSQVGSVKVNGPLFARAASVSVSNLSLDATEVVVYADGGQVGSAPRTGDATTVVVSVTPLLAQGQVITARQSVGGLLGCPPSSGPVVGSGTNSGGLRIALGVREAPLNTGKLEWVGATGTTGVPPAPTQVITPGPNWQTLTFNGSSTVQAFTGDGTITPDVNGMLNLDHIAIIRDTGVTDTGPWILYIDNVMNGANQLQGWETQTIGATYYFQQPSYSSTTGAYILTPPNSSHVTADQADTGVQSEKIEWQFMDASASAWLRLVTTSTPTAETNFVWNDGITMRVLLLPAVTCNPIWADANNDGEVDMDDFAAFQRCTTIDGIPISPDYCQCFDKVADGVIDFNDLTRFDLCARGPGIPAVAGCGE